MEREYDHEEDFWKGEKKEIRKERRIAQRTDRSKYKKSNREKLSPSRQTVSSDTSQLQGRVVSIRGEGIVVRSHETSYCCSLKGSLKKDRLRQKNLVVVGDLVDFLPLGNLQGQIVAIQKRTSLIERSDPAKRRRQLLAANIDTVFVTSSVVLPPLKPFLIDRYVIAAAKGNMEPIILINKMDLLSTSEEEKERFSAFMQAYQDLTIFPISCKTGEGVEEVKRAMRGKASLFSGQSGVGKSSLINELLHLHLPVGEIFYKGRHTTTKAELIPLEGGGFCIDTPGIRQFGIWDLTREDVCTRFTKIQELSALCKFPNCLHLQEPGCAVLEAVEKGDLPLLLYESYAKLIEEVERKKRGAP
ncbi:MAG: ribosome small subunit-dependent GTPase A [Chlamydiota bacterium]